MEKDIDESKLIKSAPPRGGSPRATSKHEANPVLDLHRSIGNQSMHRLLESGNIQAKLHVSQPHDPDEIEADRIAEQATTSSSLTHVQRKCSCSGGASCAKCEGAGHKDVHRKIQSPSVDVGSAPEDSVRALDSGQPMDEGTRASMESSLGHDFRHVRIHADSKAASRARELGSLAFTFGSDIFFDNGRYDPTTSAGQWILAHELTHVVQQSGREGEGELQSESGVSQHSEAQASKAASAAIAGVGSVPTLSKGSAARSVMLLTPDEFRKQLGATPDQKSAIAALFANKTFLALWEYLKKCPAAPKKDLGPLTLKVTPGLKIDGVERYGGYSPMGRTLEINPTKPEHKANSAELVDTITHELIHAVSDLEEDCKKAGGGAAPLAGAATASAPSRAALAGKPDEEKKLMTEQGPGASNPCEEFLDINKAAQQMVVQIIRENIKVAKVGRPTVIFVNEILRRDPAAMKAYVACRDAACAKAKPEDRQKAIAACSADIIAKFMPKDLAP